MVYINDNSQSILLPRVSNTVATKIKIENQLTHWEHIFEFGDETTKLHCEMGPTFYVVTNLIWLISTLETVGVGQFNYSIIAENDEVISTGILQYNEYTSDHKQYESEIHIIQYNG